MGDSEFGGVVGGGLELSLELLPMDLGLVMTLDLGLQLLSDVESPSLSSSINILRG